MSDKLEWVIRCTGEDEMWVAYPEVIVYAHTRKDAIEKAQGILPNKEYYSVKRVSEIHKNADMIQILGGYREG